MLARRTAAATSLQRRDPAAAQRAGSSSALPMPKRDPYTRPADAVPAERRAASPIASPLSAHTAQVERIAPVVERAAPQIHVERAAPAAQLASRPPVRGRSPVAAWSEVTASSPGYRGAVEQPASSPSLARSPLRVERVQAAPGFSGSGGACGWAGQLRSPPLSCFEGFEIDTPLPASCAPGYGGNPGGYNAAAGDAADGTGKVPLPSFGAAPVGPAPVPSRGLVGSGSGPPSAALNPAATAACARLTGRAPPNMNAVTVAQGQRGRQHGDTVQGSRAEQGPLSHDARSRRGSGVGPAAGCGGGGAKAAMGRQPVAPAERRGQEPSHGPERLMAGPPPRKS